jgi:hypothetical protein
MPEEEEELVELKFRLYDGSDIGPFRYSLASTVAMLKERIVADWPKGLFTLLNFFLSFFLSFFMYIYMLGWLLWLEQLVGVKNLGYSDFRC